MATALALICASGIAGGAGAASPPPPTPSPPSVAAPGAPAVPGAAGVEAVNLSAPMSAEEVIRLLDQTMDWYRTLDTQQQAANEPSDLSILFENRQTANEVIGFAFAVARADAGLLGQEPAAAEHSEDTAVSPRALDQLQKKLAAQQQSVQSELDSRQRLSGAPKKTRQEQQAKIAELQGELDLINTKKAIIGSMTSFDSGSGAEGAGALRAQIDAMAVALPAANAASAPAGSVTASTVPRPTTSAASNLLPTAASASPPSSRFGLWDLAANVFMLSKKLATVDTIDRRTAALQAALAAIRTRLVDKMRTLSARGDALVPQADTADGATLNALRGQFDAIANQFKQASSIFLPLSRESVLLEQYRRNLKNWRDIVQNQSRDALKALGIRLGVLLVFLGVVFAFAEFWRRTVLRYVRDPRRRYQLLLLRKIALWSLVLIVIGFAFASELGSIVTFAGLITAGVAVAMQSVLVSIVGYFFLIGKYGIRVGDRIQIGEVNGEVIDLGLVRMYLMEFGAHGAGGPTGRVVAFPNSVVFQVSTGLFKQIPGVNFSWHEMTLSVPAGADYAATKEKLNAALLDALKDYRDEIQRQTQEIQRTTSSNSGGEANPRVQLSYSSKGVEAHARYPVHLQHAAEIDERVSQALLKVISDITPAPGANT
jgi:small-conductance mechanosensitive channel